MMWEIHFYAILFIIIKIIQFLYFDPKNKRFK